QVLIIIPIEVDERRDELRAPVGDRSPASVGVTVRWARAGGGRRPARSAWERQRRRASTTRRDRQDSDGPDRSDRDARRGGQLVTGGGLRFAEVRFHNELKLPRRVACLLSSLLNPAQRFRRFVIDERNVGECLLEDDL